eukprot:1491038-Lingulodinium_polyedra.AAC.1
MAPKAKPSAKPSKSDPTAELRVKVAGRLQTPAQLASIKIRDTYKNLSDYSINILVDPTTKMTLRQTLETDIEAVLAGNAKIKWGPSYHKNLKRKFGEVSKEYQDLAPASSSSI